ncbi:hypothetical protein V5279_43495 [Bradyrhizobium sp. 26S5]|uniref:hypothetical protein n=1 Tax=Bradyrhizobium sp. 26S5 TaxID=3139729 RepID=UPI0030CDFE12
MVDSIEIAPEIVELILRTSRVKGCSEVYSLAPRGHRVAFYFQQRRATLLAAAITNRIGRDALKTRKICIIGGGASGLTFLLAISNEGAENVSLYEAGKKIVTRGARAKHRLVHPNYNRWPLLGSMDVFTSLPVLNWYAESAEHVVKQLQERIATDYDDLISNSVKTKHKAKRVTQGDASLAHRLNVTFDVEGSEVREDFQIVVIAAGFGDENGMAWGFKDYWTKEEDFDEDTHSRPCTVYGVGDGALIDIVRCCAKKPDDAWRIPLGTIARLRPQHATTLFRDNREVKVRPPIFEPMEKKIQAHEESIRSVAWAMSRSSEKTSNSYAEDEESFYLSCVSDLQRDKRTLIRFLDDSFKPIAPDHLKPVLVGTLQSAFEPTSAPINKLLLAYLIAAKRIIYSPRDRAQQSSELDLWKSEDPTVKREKITICRFGAAKNFPAKKPGKGRKTKSKAAFPAKGIEVAIGPKIIFAETDTEANLIDALSGVTGGEYVLFDAMPHRLTLARYGEDKDEVTRDTMEKNKPILMSFARDNLDAETVTFHPRSDKQSAKWVIFTALTDEEVRQRLLPLGGLDGNFFGAPIVLNSPALRDKGTSF